jgi:uncharacterized membrane protein YfcA
MALNIKENWRLMVVCGTAGAINGLFSAGGGMLLVPMLTLVAKLDEEEVFPTSVSVILPVCLVSLLFRATSLLPAFYQGFPYLIGSIPGGLLALYLSGKIPVTWLHRALGILILWGGVRYLC